MKKIILLIAMVFTLASCGNNSEVQNITENNTENQSKLQITTSLIPLASIANYIGGEYVEANSLIPVGVSAHGYDLKPNQMVDIEKSDLIVYLDLEHIDGFLNKAIESKENIVVASKSIELIEGEAHEHENEEEMHDEHELEEENECIENNGKWLEEHSECENIDKNTCETLGGNFNECASACRNDKNAEMCIMMCVPVCSFEDKDAEQHEHEEEHELESDPHVWTSSKNAIIIAENIIEGLIKIQPENKEYFEDNLKAFKNELETAKERFEEKVKDKELKEFIVFHDAYNYLFEELNINQDKKLVFQSNVLSDPSSSEMKELIDEIKLHGVKVAFKEPQLNDGNLQKLATEYNIEIDALNPLGKGSDSEGYITNYVNNLSKLEKIYE